jgi:hypothetical protein
MNSFQHGIRGLGFPPSSRQPLQTPPPPCRRRRPWQPRPAPALLLPPSSLSPSLPAFLGSQPTDAAGDRASRARAQVPRAQLLQGRPERPRPPCPDARRTCDAPCAPRRARSTPKPRLAPSSASPTRPSLAPPDRSRRAAPLPPTAGAPLFPPAGALPSSALRAPPPRAAPPRSSRARTVARAPQPRLLPWLASSGHSPPPPSLVPPLRVASPGRHAAAGGAVTGPWGLPAWGAGPRDASGTLLTAAGSAMALAAVTDVVPAGVASTADPPPPNPPSLIVDPPPVVDQPPPPVAHQGHTVAALTAARAEHAVRQARLRETTLVWEREREAADAIAAQIAAAEQLLASPVAHDGGATSSDTVGGVYGVPTAPPVGTGPRTIPTVLWHDPTDLLVGQLHLQAGVSRTFASWFLSSWSQSRRPTHAGGTYSSSPFAATLWMTTPSATPPAWHRLPRGCASTASCSPGSWGRSPVTSTASSGTSLTLGLFGLPSRASSWATPRPGLSILTQPSAPSSRETSPSVSTVAR